MTKPQTRLEKARLDAQNLHKAISANMAKAKDATWADIKAAQADAASLAEKMKTLADDQADVVRANIKTATARLDAAAKQIEDKARGAKDDIQRANAALLESAQNAAHSLSEAVAELRTKVAKAIEPKKVPA